MTTTLTKDEKGLRKYYISKLGEKQIALRDKMENLKRLQAQRNELNARGAKNFFLKISSPPFKGRTSIVTRTWFTCWRSCKTHGKEKSTRQSQSRRKVHCRH
jgi:hypothetical protein